MFRFNYKPEFLRWALLPPGFIPDWMVGVRHEATGQLCGFISGIPVDTTVHGNTMKMCEINFLCVHKDLRSKRLAPLLIKEVTRRVNLRDIWQAVYTAGVVIPSPVSGCRYYHRTINSRKLLDIGFTRLGPRMNRLRFERLHKLPDEVTLPGWRKMTKSDVPAVTKMLNDKLGKFSLHLHFSEADVRHWLLPRDGVISSFVVARKPSDAATEVSTDATSASASSADATSADATSADATSASAEEGVKPQLNTKGDLILAFTSYYHLPSSVLRNPKHTDLFAAYSYYHVATSGITTTELAHCALIAARDEGQDVFNALHLLDNASFFDELKFGPGDGVLNYYLFNWKCAKIDPGNVGIVLL
jgi:glycylpeptide N-tetradecanoyltransferase